MSRGQELQLRIFSTIAMWDPMTGIFLNRETNAVRKFMNQQIIQKKEVQEKMKILERKGAPIKCQIYVYSIRRGERKFQI